MAWQTIIVRAARPENPGLQASSPLIRAVKGLGYRGREALAATEWRCAPLYQSTNSLLDFGVWLLRVAPLAGTVYRWLREDSLSV